MHTSMKPGAPGQTSTTTASPQSPVAIGHVKAGVELMQGMISHHAQTLDMGRLLEFAEAFASPFDQKGEKPRDPNRAIWRCCQIGYA